VHIHSLAQEQILDERRIFFSGSDSIFLPLFGFIKYPEKPSTE
jgi:hypothetical protein